MTPFAAVLLAVAAPVLPPKPDDLASDAAMRFATAFISLDERAAAERMAAPFFDGRSVLDEKQAARFIPAQWEGLNLPEKHRRTVTAFFSATWKPAVVRVETYAQYRKSQTDRELVALTDRVAFEDDRVVWVTLGQETEPRAVFVRFTDGKPAVAGIHPLPSQFRALFKRDR